MKESLGLPCCWPGARGGRGVFTKIPSERIISSFAKLSNQHETLDQPKGFGKLLQGGLVPSKPNFD
jgi:hypothetical protein